MKQNKFKIIIASYNNEQWVEYNIASILNQTYTNYEVIYIDDCSQDNTFKKVAEIIEDNDKFSIIKNETNLGGTYNHIRFFDTLEDEEILVLVDGDDWLFDETVLEKLNSYYNEKDVWMTYGKFYTWDGEDATEAHPQNTAFSDFTHRHRFYRRDIWRSSHLRTYKGFLVKSIDKQDFISKIDNKLFWHAGDLALAFPCLEMCSKEKIGILDFPSYVYNASKISQERTSQRESADNHKYEIEIRNKKTYKRDLSGEKLPQVNVFNSDYYMEYFDVPKKFTYCYEQSEGEYDMVIIFDHAISDYLEGKIKIHKKVPVVARLLEQRDYFHKKLFNLILENYNKFHTILTFDKCLLENIPNAKFLPAAFITEFNRLPNPGNHPPLKSPLFDTYELPEDALKIYPKNKLVSCVTSNKAFLPGHLTRLNFVSSIKDKVDLYGRGIKEIPSKLEALRDYMFSVAIENNTSADDYYFTEKITECFLTGTIPIYHGCPNIGEFFDERGILSFNTEEELHNIIDNLNEEKYQSMLEYAKINFQKCFTFAITNDDTYEKYYKDIIKNYSSI